MSLNNMGQFRANGTIAPSRMVVMDTTGDNLVLQASSTTVPILGVSQVGMKRTPGLAGSDVTIAAQQNDPIQLFGLGDVVPLEIGTGGCTRGDLLGPDANGKGITVAHGVGTEIGARALQNAVAGQIVLVQILCRNA